MCTRHLLLTAALLAAFAAVGVRADEADEELQKYNQPLDEAIDRALEYLAANQLKDGSFKTGMRGNAGITALCVMAFLSKGHTPDKGPYGEVINKGIDYVMDSQQGNGLLIGSRASGAMYGHCMATLMLSEVSGMVDPPRQERLDRVLGHAVRVILSAQRMPKPPNFRGGWRYQHTSRDSDISLTGWALMSLRSARGNGADIPKSSIDEAVGFIMRCYRGGGGFAYQPGGAPGPARTGVALLCLELCGHHRTKVTLAAGDYLRGHLPRSFGGSGYFYYTLYYCAQGMFQLGDQYWRDWAEHMYKMMLKFQKKDGSWPPGGASEATAGACYATAMGVLAMTVSYRQLPIYQR